MFNNKSVVFTTKIFCHCKQSETIQRKKRNMDQYYNQIKNSPVFFGISEEELKAMLECFNARIKTYDKDEMIIRQGDMVTNIYLILEGAVNIEKDTYWGRRMIISQLSKNDNIALAFVASKNMECSIDAISTEKSKLLILSFSKCTSMCTNACTKHKLLINNLFEILSKENIELIRKIENISQKTIRDKLLTYLSNEAKRNKSNVFEIPFNRQDMADYLNIDRSAMSFELSKLQKEGFLNFDRNKFELLGKF